jgi:hypothetical protein
MHTLTAESEMQGWFCSGAGNSSHNVQGLVNSDGCRELLLRVPANELRMRTHEIYRNLGDWLLAKTESEIEERYVGIGMRRAKKGVPFSELLLAFALTKDCLWEHLEQNGLFDDPLELIGDLHLLRSVARFFDRITHASAVGYEAAHGRESYSSKAGRSADTEVTHTN